MCNEFARQKQLADAIAEFDKRGLPLFGWRDGLVPNLDAQPQIRIRDTAVVVRLRGGALEGEAVTWAWPGPRGAPVFNFRSEGRDFSHNDRVLVLADGFFEYTAPQAGGVKLKDRQIVTFAPQAGMDWLTLARPEGELLRPGPAGSLAVRTLRRDGVDLAA